LQKRTSFLLYTVIVALIAGYLGVDYILYDRLSNIVGGCDLHAGNRPDYFVDPGGSWEGFDFSAYYMPNYQSVRFPSREEGIEIAGWYVEADPEAPAVIVVHGFGSCKNAHTVLTPAGILWHAGFNVLMIDVRDAGDSTIEDGRSAVGNEEYLDVLGAWDWLIQARGIPPNSIGLMGNSLGAGTVLIAFSQELQVAAVFADSPYDTFSQILREEVQRINLPTFLIPGGILVARLVSGDNVLAHNPADAIYQAGERPIYILHGTEDQRIGVHHSLQLQDKAEDAGANVTFWIAEGVYHVQAAASRTKEFEERLVTFFQTTLESK
jgi:dipeptidyl aminopeptidase/acylaminoacyl peptidase